MMGSDAQPPHGRCSNILVGSGFDKILHTDSETPEVPRQYTEVSTCLKMEVCALSIAPILHTDHKR